MKTKLFILALSMICFLPAGVFASEDEVEIPLIEISFMFIPGDAPLGNPNQGESTPPSPSDFRATITGRTLAVTVDNPNSTLLIVRNAAGVVVLNSPFYDFTSESLTQAGAYSLELRNAGMTLVGQFNAQ